MARLTKARLIISLLIMVVLFITILSLAAKKSDQSAVTLKSENNVTIELGLPSNDTVGKIIATAKDNHETVVHVTKGQYAVLYQQANHDSQLKFITVQGPSALLPPQLSLSKSYLQQQLQQNQSAINTALSALLPATYSIAAQRIINDGTWCTAMLTTTDPASDTLRVILHSSGSAWVVAAPPKIVLAKADYPKIPGLVVEDADSPF
jgi:hypothetical protein